MRVQAGLCRTWSETQTVGFLIQMLKLNKYNLEKLIISPAFGMSPGGFESIAGRWNHSFRLESVIYSKIIRYFSISIFLKMPIGVNGKGNYQYFYLIQGNKEYSSNYILHPITYEPPHGKTNNLHMRKQRRRSASR